MTTDERGGSGGDLHSPDNAAAIKACCATSYSSDLVTLLLGESYHPGGLTVSRRLLDRLDLAPGQHIVDVASGKGTTSLLAASEYDVAVDGVDLAVGNVALGSAAADARGLADLVRFHHGDAEALPFPDGVFDAVICECALCTFPDKTTAISQMARVLRPGGRIGLTDVTADQARLPASLRGMDAWVACVADARPALEYEALLVAQGLRIRAVEQHQDAIERMILQIAARVELLRMTNPQRAQHLGLDFDRVPQVIRAAQAAVDNGALGYVLIVADKP
jgi:arsenite methyltransferase